MFSSKIQFRCKKLFDQVFDLIYTRHPMGILPSNICTNPFILERNRYIFVTFIFRVMNSKVVKDGGGSMKSLSSGKKDSNTPHIDSGVDSGLSYRSQNSNSNSDSQCSDSASCNSTQCAQVK